MLSHSLNYVPYGEVTEMSRRPLPKYLNSYSFAFALTLPVTNNRVHKAAIKDVETEKVSEEENVQEGMEVKAHKPEVKELAVVC